MAPSGIVRKVDELRRIVIPIEITRVFGIADNDPMDISMEGQNIVLKQYEPTCVFCNGTA